MAPGRGPGLGHIGVGRVIAGRSGAGVSQAGQAFDNFGAFGLAICVLKLVVASKAVIQ